MARVTDEQVKEIIDTELDTTPFIETAHIVVNQLLEDTSCHTEESLEQVELYLAAHFTALRERQLTSEEAMGAQDQYGGKFGMGYNFTQYGQTALLLDCSGELQKSQEGRKKAKFDTLQMPEDDYGNVNILY